MVKSDDEIESRELLVQAVGAEVELARLTASRSWRWTSPVRVAYSTLRSQQLALTKYSRIALRKLPVSSRLKHSVKSALAHVKGGRRHRDGPPGPLSMIGMLLGRDRRAYVVATPHVAWLADELVRELRSLQVDAVILQDVAPESEILHFILSPNAFTTLPRHYVAFQLEQTTNNRWITDDYARKLRGALACLDYTSSNFTYLEAIGVSFDRRFYVPPSRFETPMDDASWWSEWQDRSIPILFYGDISSSRRREALEVLGHRFAVRVETDLFGDQLDSIIRDSKVVVNIHYYERAQAESPRIFQAVGLGAIVISEDAADRPDTAWPRGVLFTEERDWSALASELDRVLRAKSPDEIQWQQPQQDGVFDFSYFFRRFLVATGFIEARTLFVKGRLKRTVADPESFGVCLTLPETPERRAVFRELSNGCFTEFPGMRHQLGWKGCALSYRILAREALNAGCQDLVIAEDDLVVTSELLTTLRQVRDFLRQRVDWDVFVGLIADLDERAKITWVEDHAGITYVGLDRMTSMVCNLYSASGLRLLANWPVHGNDVHTNTIDRFLERQANLRVVTVLPFLAQLNEDSKSSLWGIGNDVYVSLIRRSEEKLTRRVEKFLDV